MYCAYVTRIHNLRKHTNADRLLCGECFGNTVIVDLGTDPDQLGVYFPTDGKLGLEFAQKNDLLRRKDENGAPAGGYLDPEKRNIKALKLRGEKSDGLFLPLSCLASFTDIKKLQEGDTISVLNGITICEKYIPAVKRASGSGGGNHVRKRSDPISPLFQEHADTEQLAYNLSAFHAGDLVEVTLKMHGTSQRTGYLPVLQGYKYRNRMEKRLYESRKTPNVIRSKIKRAPIYDWGYVTGTRRVVLGTFDEGGYATIQTDAWFGYNIQKMCSVSASMATMAFNREFERIAEDWFHDNGPYWKSIGVDVDVDLTIYKRYNAYQKKMFTAMFDSRAFSVPKEEVCNCLIWRQQDATRNSIEAVGQANFSHHELHKKTCNMIQEMLWSQRGINWNDFPTELKRGSCCIKRRFEETIDDPRNPGQKITVCRNRWIIDHEIPIFTQDREYLERLI